MIATKSLPDLHRAVAVVSTRCNVCAIGRPGQGMQIGCMILVNKVILASAGFPDSYGRVARAGGNPGAIGRPGNGKNIIAVALVGDDGSVDRHLLVFSRSFDEEVYGMR